jgi:hypothetical protein
MNLLMRDGRSKEPTAKTPALGARRIPVVAFLAVDERRITRDVEPSAVRDLLDRPPRATVAFVDGERVAVVPARLHVDGDRFVLGVDGGSAPDLTGREVVLVADDGPYWFELRGISIRGTAAPARASVPAHDPGLAWYAVDAHRVLGWDYATLREA